MHVFNWFSYTLGVRRPWSNGVFMCALFFCGMLGSSTHAYAADCPPLMSEGPALGEPAHSAQLVVSENELCERTTKLIGTILSGDKAVSSRTFYDSDYLGTTVVLPVRDELTLPNVAGAYQIEWMLSFEDGTTQRHVQPFVLACPPPQAPSFRWVDSESTLYVTTIGGDACEGQAAASLSLVDITGKAVEGVADQVVDLSQPAELSYAIPELAGEHRYTGTLLLTNQAELTTRTNVEFVTGCGELRASTEIVEGRMLGSVEGSDCQFPIQLDVEVTHAKGDVVQTVNAVLKSASFDFALPNYDTWPAGSYTITTTFAGVTSRSRVANELEIVCEPPTLSDPILTPIAGMNKAEVSFELANRNVCQNQTRISLQVRDVDRVVVFNTSEDVQPGSGTHPLKWAFRGIPGSTYTLEVSAAYGISQSEQIDAESRLLYECAAPSVLEFGFSSPDASYASALLGITLCNAPASAKLVVRNHDGRVVVNADPQIIRDVGTAYARISPVTLGHLDSGEYVANLVVSDNRGRTAQKEITLLRDVDGPVIGFNTNESKVDQGATLPLKSLDEVFLSFSDANDPLAVYHLEDDVPEATLTDAHATILRIDGENTPQIWVTGFVNRPRTDSGWGFVGVVSKDPSGALWSAPVVRTHVPTQPAELKDFHPAASRIGFRSVARVQDLQNGRHELVGVIISDEDGTHSLLEVQGNFTVSSRSTQQQDAVLRQGVTEIPISLQWGEGNTAALQKVTSVPDGTYTLSVVGRDIYGNPSKTHSVVIKLDQNKKTAELDWPGIVGYKRTIKHSFRTTNTGSAEPLRVLYRVVSGYGATKINGREISSRTSEDLLVPDASGRFTIDIELLEDEVDSRVVIHADATDAIPLELAIRTHKPAFVTQRTRTETEDTLTITQSEQNCSAVVFDDLSRVTVTSGRTLCAVRLGFEGANVISSKGSVTKVRLKAGVPSTAMYEEGFVRRVDGVLTFSPTAQVPLSSMRSYSATPQVQFVPLSEWRDRVKTNANVTAVGDVIAGHLVIEPGLETPIVTINGNEIDLANHHANQIRIPVHTNIDTIGESQKVTLRAFYPSTPDVVAEESYAFRAIPDRARIDALGGELIYPAKTSLALRIEHDSVSKNAPSIGAFEIESATIVNRDDGSSSLNVASTEVTGIGEFEVGLGELLPGEYRLLLSLRPTDQRYAQYVKPVEAVVPFQVLDGTPIQANVFSFRATDRVPFFGQLSIDYAKDARRTDVKTVSWEVSDDGKTFAANSCCGTTLDFGLPEPGSRFYRAVIENVHSGETSTTEPVELQAFVSGKLDIAGPRYTYRGYPASYKVMGLPSEYEVLWRVTSPNTNIAREVRSSTLTIDADETGRYFVEVVADTVGDKSDSKTALRTFFTLETSWPRLPESVISGPTRVEFGKTETYTVSHPPIFDGPGNDRIVRVGEWQLPDGTKVQDDEWTEFTLKSMPEGFTAQDILYHTWLKGDRTTITTAVHRIEPISYVWPNWKLKATSNSVEPPAVSRLSVAPDKWQDWMGLGDSEVTTHWDLPDYIRVLEQTPTEVIIYAADDRAFDVTARITDPRGNVTVLEQANVRPVRHVPFEISLKAEASRSLLTAPIDMLLTVDPIILPKDRSISRVAIYVDSEYRGTSDGAPIEVEIRRHGEHRVRAIASIDGEFSADETITINLAKNHRATCSVSAIGNFRLNGLAKAECDDPDGHMVEYRWYADGQILTDSGTRVVIPKVQRHRVREISLIAVDNAGVETSARYVPPAGGDEA